MSTSVNDMVAMVTVASEVVSSAKFSDADKQIILGEMLLSLPPVQLCPTTKGTRGIVHNKIQEALDGFTTTQAKSKKPVKSGQRKAPPKSPKK